VEELNLELPNTNPSIGREEDLNSVHSDYNSTRPIANDVGMLMWMEINIGKELIHPFVGER